MATKPLRTGRPQPVEDCMRAFKQLDIALGSLAKQMKEDMATIAALKQELAGLTKVIAAQEGTIRLLRAAANDEKETLAEERLTMADVEAADRDLEDTGRVQNELWGRMAAKKEALLDVASRPVAQIVPAENPWTVQRKEALVARLAAHVEQDGAY